MGRRYTRDTLYKLFDTIKKNDPDAVLRTTAMVGFPGETDADFNMLLQFAKDSRFAHLGTFLYSDSEDILSHKLDNHVTDEKAKERYDRLMSCQQDISLEINTQHMGNIYQVLVEGASDENTYKGRTYFQAPESDGLTYIHSSKHDGLHTGQFLKIRIAKALEYDLIGDVA